MPKTAGTLTYTTVRSEQLHDSYLFRAPQTEHVGGTRWREQDHRGEFRTASAVQCGATSQNIGQTPPANREKAISKGLIPKHQAKFLHFKRTSRTEINADSVAQDAQFDGCTPSSLTVATRYLHRTSWRNIRNCSRLKIVFGSVINSVYELDDSTT